MSRRFGVLFVLTAATTCLLVAPLTQMPSRPRPNIVLISIDTLRADHVGAYGYSQRTSPFIDSVAARGTVFDDVVAPMPATGPSHAAMLTGLHPLRTQLLANALQLRDDFDTLAEAFRRNGYTTIGATGVYHLSERYGFARGFDRLTSASDRDKRRQASLVNSDVLSMLADYRAAGAKRPLFLFVHYFDVHAPYRTHPDPLSYAPGRAPAALLADLTDAYDDGIRWVDGHVRELWVALERAGLTRNTVLAITADHGEQLGEHGFTGGHADLYRETIRVPLVMAGPGLPHERIADTVSVMDVAPTLLDLAGLRLQQPTEGVSILSRVRGEKRAPALRGLLVLGYPTYTRSIAWRNNQHYYVRNLEHVYHSLSAQPLAAKAREGVPTMREAPMRDQGGQRVFAIPPVDFQPYRIVLDIFATPGCSADVVISIAPGVQLSKQLKLAGPTHVTYSIARLDSSFETVTPGHCVERVAWGFQRFTALEEGTLDDGGTSTYLFDTLVAQRKRGAIDELYDVVADPQMLQNLIAEETPEAVARMKAALELAFRSYPRAQDGSAGWPADELERLRSLGYVR